MLEDLDWPINQSFPFHHMDVPQNWQQQQQRQQPGTTLAQSSAQRASLHHLQPLPTTHRFPSTHLRQSPNQHQPTHANGPSPDSTLMGRPHPAVETSFPQDHLQDLATTSTAPNPALSLDGSPSWSSAMTPMSMEFGPFYPQQAMAAEQLRDQLPLPDSAHPHLLSHSSIDLHPHHQHQAQHYAQELRRQQYQQLHQQRQQTQPQQALPRRPSVEDDYLQALGGSQLHHPHPPTQPPQAAQEVFYEPYPVRTQLHPHPLGVHYRRGEETRSLSTSSNNSTTSTGRNSSNSNSNNNLGGSSSRSNSSNANRDPPSLMHMPPPLE